MAGFPNFKTIVDQHAAGASVITSWRKAPAIVTAAGYWVDLAMSPGNPKPNYYASAPLISAAIANSTDTGIFHGGAVSPKSKHLEQLMAMTQTAGAVPLHLRLCDYLLYYPFIEEAGSDEQVMNLNVASPVGLPRYTDGVGVQMMAVVVAGHTGSPATTFTVRYTNQAGEGNRTSIECKLSPGQFVNGTLLTAAPATIGCNGPFIPLQLGDTGVRSVQGVTIASGGDVGLFTLVLVKPLFNLSIRGIDAPAEECACITRPSMPRIYDDAYLNFIAMAAGSITGAQINGTAQFVWSA